MIKRFDYLIKPFAFLVLSLHWFNPLVWLAFFLMSKDMEMSCDEQVLKKMGRGVKKSYSQSLLSLAGGGPMISGSPLAFGESSVKGRIKNVLSYKKPSFWAIIIGLVMVSVLEIGLLTNPKDHHPDLSFLNINNTTSRVIQQDQVLIRHGRETSLVSGNELGEFLDLSSSKWKESKVSSAYELPSDLTIYINIGSGHEVVFYESEPKLAMVLFEGKYRHYKIPADTYEKVYMMWTNSSFVIPEQVMSALVNGKRINKKSVQDVPNNSDFQILKVGNDKYFIYGKSDKYYVEAPYQFIDEINEDIYKDAIQFAIQAEKDQSIASLDEETLLELAKEQWTYEIEML